MSNQDGKNTSLYTWSRPGDQASLRQITVEGTENSWAKLELASSNGCHYGPIFF